MKKILLAFCVVTMLSMPSLTQADFSIAGYTFDDIAGVDALLSSSGTFNTSGTGALADVLTDNSADTWAFSGDQGAYVELGFVDNFLVNGLGDDLLIFEIGVPDTLPVSLVVNGVAVAKTPVATGFVTDNNNDAGINYSINVATWDLLADFGLPGGSLLPSIAIDMGPQIGGAGAASVAFIGALNTQVVPVPGAALLGVLGLSAAGAKLRRRRKA